MFSRLSTGQVRRERGTKVGKWVRSMRPPTYRPLHAGRYICSLRTIQYVLLTTYHHCILLTTYYLRHTTHYVRSTAYRF